MRKHLTIIFFTLALGQCYAQKVKYEQELALYKHSITYPDHKLVFQLQPSGEQPVSIVPEKKYHWYSNNEIKVTQGGYSGKLLHGSYTDYYFNNNLKEQGRFEMGLKVGEWNTWAVQGLLLEKSNFKKGSLDGNFFRYNGTGELIETGQYKQGKPHGKWTRYFGKDSTALTVYKMGRVKASQEHWLKQLWFNRHKSKENK